MRCVLCGNEELQSSTVEETVEVGELCFKTMVPAEVCPECGEDYMDASVLRWVEGQVAQALAREGASTPDAFRYMRKVIGLKAVELAGMLEVAPETVSRWENGERKPEIRAAKLLGVMVLEFGAGRCTVQDYLRSLRQRSPNLSGERRLDLRSG